MAASFLSKKKTETVSKEIEFWISFNSMYSIYIHLMEPNRIKIMETL